MVCLIGFPPLAVGGGQETIYNKSNAIAFGCFLGCVVARRRVVCAWFGPCRLYKDKKRVGALPIWRNVLT